MRKSYIAAVLGLSVLILAGVTVADGQRAPMPETLFSKSQAGPFNPQVHIRVVAMPSVGGSHTPICNA